MPSESVAVSATRAHQKRLAATADAAGIETRRLWAEFVDAGMTNRADMLTWYSATRPGVAAIAENVAAATSGYAALLTDGRIVAVDGTVFAELVDPDSPFLRLWRDLNNGEKFDDAVEASLNVAAQMGGDTVHAVARNVIGKATETFVPLDPAGRMRGTYGPRQRWARVMTGSETCRWCAVVSTQTYASQDSATFGHNHCDCLVVPVAESDPGQLINRDLYDQLNSDGTLAAAAQRRRVVQLSDSVEKNAARRDETLAELATETDMERRARLSLRARTWDLRVQSQAAKQAEAAARAVPSLGRYLAA